MAWGTGSERDRALAGENRRAESDPTETPGKGQASTSTRIGDEPNVHSEGLTGD